jgi:phage tail protein X
MCQYYTVVQGDTIDGIAYSNYGNAQLGWAIMDANPALQSEMDIKAGDVIKIPPFDEVVKYSE